MSNPWIGYPVCIGLALAVAATGYGLYLQVKATLYDRREAKHTAAGVRAASDGHAYIGELMAPPVRLALPPGPSARAATTGPPWDILSDGWDYGAAALTRGTGQLAMLPDDEPADVTGVIPVVHAELGVATTGEFVEIAFAEADAAAAAAWNGVIP